MFDSIINAYRDMILLESLDKPYNLTDVTHLNQKAVGVITKDGGSRIKLYTCDDEPGHAFISYFKDGAFEIHHQHVKDGQELTGKNHMTKMPTRFVSTAFHLASDHIDSGHSVRIVGTNDHIDVYHRLAKRIAKSRGYTVNDIQEHDKASKHFLFQPGGKNLGIGIVKTPETKSFIVGK